MRTSRATISLARILPGSRRGQGAVEFALTAPLVLLLLFGIVDFGRAIFYQVELNNAAREGGRVAILASNPCNTVVGNAVPGDCSASSASGTTVCQAVRNETNLIAANQWNDCPVGGGDTTGKLPCTVTAGNTTCTGSDNQAYVELNQVACPVGGCVGTVTCSQAIVTPASGYATGTPRKPGNLPVQVKIVYFYRPLTPFLSKFFPAGFFLYSSACARPEY